MFKVEDTVKFKNKLVNGNINVNIEDITDDNKAVISYIDTEGVHRTNSFDFSEIELVSPVNGGFRDAGGK